ncbi:hypothetical protein, partial [Klebsiella aerogenes]|uniref:hypothetical protein n=1 Tax=Klebsiella aerogenes TaxID=548 RepID=UPI002230398F
RIEPRRRFVRKQERRILRQGTGDQHPRPLAAGKVESRTMAQLLDIHPLHRLFDQRRIMRARPHALPPRIFPAERDEMFH